jgi:hypothetical protein
MAEISSTENHKKPIVGVTKSKKVSTHVDLTPMVDLGFLHYLFHIYKNNEPAYCDETAYAWRPGHCHAHKTRRRTNPDTSCTWPGILLRRSVRANKL